MNQKVTVAYTLRRSRRRTIGIEVHSGGEILVRSPLRTPLYEIETLLRAKGAWIRAKVEELTQAKANLPLLPGNEWEYFRGSPRLKRRGLRTEARRVFQEYIDELLPALGVSALRYRELRVRSMKRRWGSCAPDGCVTLNLHLIALPDHCIKAVVAHELAHLVHLHHGPEFYELVQQIWDGYKQADAEVEAWTSVLDAADEKEKGTNGPLEKRIVWL